MTELLDQDVRKPNLPWGKWFNLVLIAGVVGMVGVTILVVMNSEENPLLPHYLPYYTHGSLINFTIIQLGGLPPGLFLRLRKKYTLSSICLGLFILVALLFMNRAEFYLLFV